MTTSLDRRWFAMAFAGTFLCLLPFVLRSSRDDPPPTEQHNASSQIPSSPQTGKRTTPRNSIDPGTLANSRSAPLGLTTFPVAPASLGKRLFPNDLVPRISGMAPMVFSLSPEAVETIDRALASAVEKVKEVEANHLVVTADESGHPVVTVTPWVDAGESILAQLVADLSPVTTPEQANYIARHITAPAFGDWGQHRQEFVVIEQNGTRAVGIRRNRPSQPSSRRPRSVTPSNPTEQAAIQARYGHILQHFPGLDE